MKLNLDAIAFAPEDAQVTGRCTFDNINATPYYMESEDPQRPPNAGISFVFEGGKFSAPLDPGVAQQLAAKADRQKLMFSKVELLVQPASFGREKKTGIKAVRVIALFCGKEEIFRDEPFPAKK